MQKSIFKLKHTQVYASQIWKYYKQFFLCVCEGLPIIHKTKKKKIIDEPAVLNLMINKNNGKKN